MPVKNFSLKGNMNFKNTLRRIRLNNDGMSPILIVVVVLSVLVLGGVGLGVYTYFTNPFLRVYDSSNKLMNIKEVKSLELGGEFSANFNVSKLAKKFLPREDASNMPEVTKELEMFDMESFVKFGMNMKFDIEKDNISANFYSNMSNLTKPEYSDFLDKDGTLLNMDVYVAQMSKDKVEKTAMRINKLPNYFPIPTKNGVFKLKTDPLLNSWLDITETYNSSNSSRNSKDDTKTDSSKDETPNTIITCDYKELSFTERISLARIGTSQKLFSRAENKGQVDLDGMKATKLEFEIDMKNRDSIVESLDEMSKIVCKDSSKLKNDELIDGLIKDGAISNLIVNYFIDAKTNYPTRLSLDIIFNEEIIGSKLSLKGEFNLRNINNTKVEKPSNILNQEEVLKKYMEFLTPYMELSTGMSQESSMGGSSSMSGSKCVLPENMKTEWLNKCAGGNTSMTTRNYCNCALTQLSTVSCGDTKGLEEKVRANCLNR